MDKRLGFKQVFWVALINYSGVLIGIFSTLFIYPQDKAFLGIIRYIESIVQILLPLIVLGVSQSLINFYPSLIPSDRNRLFTYSVFSITLSSVFVLVVLLVSSLFMGRESLQYGYIALPITIALAFTDLFKFQSNYLQKLAIPALFEKLIPKIALPVVFVLLLQGLFSVRVSIGYYAAAYISIFIFTAIYLFSHFQPAFDLKFYKIFRRLRARDYFRYSLYSLAGSFGSFFAFRIDSLMIPKFLSFEANGTYNIGVALASVLAIPATGVFAWYGPLISQYLKTGQLKELHAKYVEQTKNLFFIGALFYSCIFLGIHPLFEMLPGYHNLAPSIPIILILGCGVLINMGTGFNSEIISYSKYYAFNLIVISVLVVLNVLLNWFFLTQTRLGITGVAYASLISMFVFNMMKLLFIYTKLRIQPYDTGFVKLVVLIGLSGTVIYFLPEMGSRLLTLLYKVSLSLLLNVWVVYKLKLVRSLNFFIDRVLNTLKG